MKVKASLKKRCNYCYLVKRRKKIMSKKGSVTIKPTYYIYCKVNPKHKQKQA